MSSNVELLLIIVWKMSASKKEKQNSDKCSCHAKFSLCHTKCRQSSNKCQAHVGLMSHKSLGYVYLNVLKIVNNHSYKCQIDVN